MQRLRRGFQLCLFTLILATTAQAVLSGSDSPPPTAPSHPDYHAGMDAFKRGDWRAVITYMTKAIERRPWHDDAYNAMGYAYRQLGNYPAALSSYHKALELNPHHRGALEYLGETYLFMGCAAKARETLAILATACQRLSDAAGNRWQQTCEEWLDLKAAIDASRQQDRPDCHPD
jgi:tetratricopeptide (TPR) repeat protein